MESPQYHHFVPQFLLKNFAHKYKPPKRNATPSSQNDKSSKRLYRGDLVINYLDLTSSDAEFKELPVKRAFGQTDMYRDTAKPPEEQQHIEQMLSRLESEASVIFRKITDAHNNNNEGVILTRNERNLVRKFLFIMKYRGCRFHLRFCHDLATDYFANDRDKLLEYMRVKGFANPMEVWLDNIEVIINLEMGEDLNWISELRKRIYPDDAEWFINHSQSMYMTFCTPSKPEDEFIVPDNSYRIYEGPSSMSYYANAGVSEEKAWVNSHEFAPVSPKLIIILRSFLLPEPLEDADTYMKQTRQMWWSLAVGLVFGNDTNSVLADLPVCKAMNNYSQIVNERLRPLPGEDGSLKSSHKFIFTFFPIQKNHVLKINGIFLDNASTCNGIVYNSKQTFRSTLEWYLAEPFREGKRVFAIPKDARFQCLMKLVAVLEKMGSKVKPVWEEISPPELGEDESARIHLKLLKKSLPSLLKHLPDVPTEFMQTYNILGGSTKTLARDMEQGQLMIRLRTKIDVWSQGIDERIRQKNRKHLTDLYLQFPRRRLWFYLKLWRAMIFRGPGPSYQLLTKDVFDGPEDVVAQCWRVTESEVNKVMYSATESDIRLIELGLNGYQKLEHDYSRRKNMRQPLEIMFENTITQCGIKELEDIASSFKKMAHSTWPSDLSSEPYLELQTRRALKAKFKDILRGRVEDAMMDRFETIFFGSIYPIVRLDEL